MHFNFNFDFSEIIDAIGISTDIERVFMNKKKIFYNMIMRNILHVVFCSLFILVFVNIKSCLFSLISIIGLIVSLLMLFLGYIKLNNKKKGLSSYKIFPVKLFLFFRNFPLLYFSIMLSSIVISGSYLYKVFNYLNENNIIDFFNESKLLNLMEVYTLSPILFWFLILFLLIVSSFIVYLSNMTFKIFNSYDFCVIIDGKVFVIKSKPLEHLVLLEHISSKPCETYNKIMTFEKLSEYSIYKINYF